MRLDLPFQLLPGPVLHRIQGQADKRAHGSPKRPGGGRPGLRPPHIQRRREWHLRGLFLHPACLYFKVFIYGQAAKIPYQLDQQVFIWDFPGSSCNPLCRDEIYGFLHLHPFNSDCPVPGSLRPDSFCGIPAADICE